MGSETQLYSPSNRCAGCHPGAKIVFGVCSKVDRTGVFRASAPGEFQSQRFIVSNAMKLFSRKMSANTSPASLREKVLMRGLPGRSSNWCRLILPVQGAAKGIFLKRKIFSTSGLTRELAMQQ